MRCVSLNGKVESLHRSLMAWIYICVGLCLLCATIHAEEDVSHTPQVANVPPSVPEEKVSITEVADVVKETHNHVELQPSETKLNIEETVIANGNGLQEQLKPTSTSKQAEDQSVTSIESKGPQESTQSALEPTPTDSPALQTGTSPPTWDNEETATQSVSVVQSETLLQTKEEATEPKESAEESEQVSPEAEEIPAVAVDAAVDEVDVNKSTLPERPDAQHETDTTSTQDGGPSVQLLKEEIKTDEKSGDKEIKSDAEGLTFNEWTQKVLAEAEKVKQDAAHTETAKVVQPPIKQRKKKNYALHDCGAKVLANNPEATNTKGVLNSNKDDYMINPCKAKKWFVIELCEPIQAHSIEIASLELFSSQPKSIKVFLSDRYPTKDWKFVGEFNTTDERTIQSFQVKEGHDYFAKFVRVELVDHFGDEHFCPLTLFRIYGIAVVDYEEEDHSSPSGDDDDDEDEMGEDVDQESKNLFVSAKDTVLNIVKKVLNVEAEIKPETNVTGQDGNIDTLNGTVAESHNDSLPCVPGADTGEKDKFLKQPVVQVPGDIQPQTPEPGKTDIIVTKLEDHEQIETVTLPQVSCIDDKVPSKTGLEMMGRCLTYGHIIFSRKSKQFKKCSAYSRKCEFLFYVLGISVPWLPDKHHNKKDQHKVVTIAEDKTKVTYDVASSKLIEKNATVLVTDSTSEDTKDQSITRTQSEKIMSSSQVHDGSRKTVDQSKSQISSQSSVKDNTEISTITSISASETQPQSSSVIKATPVVVSILQTDSASSVSQSAHGSLDSLSDTKVKDGVLKTESEFTATGSVKIDPSPTSVLADLKITQSSLSKEATPELPHNWKPDTDDMMESRTEMGTKTQIDKSEQNLPMVASVVDSAVVQDSTVSASHDSSQLDPPKVPDTVTKDTEVKDAVVDPANQDKDDVGRDSGLTGKSDGNATFIMQKPMEDGDKQKDLHLVRVPLIPSNKRESAIMRLSNRIKVLEQNVSLSSRFLEELSRRYKKQSEDMMKMLNRTVAKLNNMTVEADVNNKIHEDELGVMEQRLENLTSLVNHLSSSLEQLNKQVTDRQMIWTTIEIIIIFIMLIFLFRRQRAEPLPPEVRSMIESMPTKPAPTLSLSTQRRNSLSGPSTPSKKIIGDIQTGETLNKYFSSETNLAHSDYPIIQPVEPINRQATDGVKKKKKKKTKLSDGVLPSNVKANSFTKFSQAPDNFTGSKLSSGSACSSGSCTAGLMLKVGEFCQSIRTSSSETNNGASEHSNSEQCREGAKSDAAIQGIGLELTRKPPIPAKAGKPSNNGATISPDILRHTDKSGTKGHKRQKSLPKQHYPMVEAIGASDFRKNGTCSHDNPRLNSDPSILTTAPNKWSLKKSNSAPSPSNYKQTLSQSGKISGSQPPIFNSVNKPLITGTTSPGGRNKKLPQCGVQALFYGSEDQFGANQTGGNKIIRKEGFAKGLNSHITNGLDPSKYTLDPSKCGGLLSNEGGSVMDNSHSLIITRNSPGAVNGTCNINGEHGLHDDCSDTKSDESTVGGINIVEGSNPETKQIGTWKKIFGLIK